MNRSATVSARVQAVDMTRVVWEHYQQDPMFEDMVSVLLSRLHPNAERIDGAGGDGGRDVQLRSPGRLDLFEVKSFTGRLSPRSPNRRKQVEESLTTAAALQPDSWTLVVPINHNDSELKWFDGLREAYDFPLDWKDRDWLDEQMAAFPDVRRYYLEGAADEVVRLISEMRYEEAGLVGGAEDALDRMKRIRSRLNDIDPQYRIEISPGPVVGALAAFPNAVMYQQNGRDDEDPWTISILARYRDAPNDRPIQINANLVFNETAASADIRDQWLELMQYGSDEPVLVPEVADVTVDAPAGLGGEMPTGSLKFWAIPDDIEIRARLETTDPSGIPLASAPVTFTKRVRGQSGVTLYGAHDTDLLQVRLRVTSPQTGSLQFTVHPIPEYSPMEILPLLRFLATLTAPNQASLTVNGKALSNPENLQDSAPVSPGFVGLVEDLAKLQSATGNYFRIRGDLTAGEVSHLNRMLQILEGKPLELQPKDRMDIVRDTDHVPVVGHLFEILAMQFWHSENFLGEEIPLGPCFAIGGPWEVAQGGPQDPEGSLWLSSTDETRWILRRGALTADPVLPGSQPRLLCPGTPTPDATNSDPDPGVAQS